MRQLKITKQITNRETASLSKYLQEVSKEEMITAEEEVQLTIKIKQGDEVALDKMVRANLRFVVSVAKQYQNQGLTLPDLINEGNLGLIKAAKRFDETRGFKFISYAVWWIRQSILQALADQARIVRLPLNKIGNINKINRAISALEQKYEREPTVDELASTIEVSEKEIEKNMRNQKRHVSMDAPLGNEDESRNLYDVMGSLEENDPSENLMRESLAKEIQRSMNALSPREKDVLNLYFGLSVKHPLTLQEIGDQYDLTRERVRQIKERGLRRLKQISRSKILRSYLG